ncbi:MAG: phenylalanine--tRNA ligase subunit alpha [Proteobacteria bacterium]|nr:phenylalanine--tRNA ligase subunit alpha [Pseudomonadota bacterium]
MEDELHRLQTEALAALESGQDPDELKVRYLGRKGRLTAILRGVKDLPVAKRPGIGQLANRLKAELEAALARAASDARGGEAAFGLDIGLPGRRGPLGRLHPITQTETDICDIFIRMGFSVVETREVELDYYCFEALNMPPDHPARDMQDTFYITEDVVLRTHTSPAQVRTMESTPPPVKIVCPGKAFRRDSDVTHTPMFHQVEGLLVDEGVSFGDLKGVLAEFVRQLFGPRTPLRFRPSFFPFTEPSAEVDIGCVVCRGKGCRVCKQTGWLEILGSGMVDPNVYGFVDYDPDVISGFAFGMGVERIAMLRYGIDDIRLFFQNDLRFLRQF